MVKDSWWNGEWHGKPNYSEINLPSATMSATNPAGTVRRLNPALRGEQPAHSLLTYGTDETH